MSTSPIPGFPSAHQVQRMVPIRQTVLSILLATLACDTCNASLVISWSGGSMSYYIDSHVSGYEFTVGASDLLVTSFGIWDADGNGLYGDNSVGLWTEAGDLVAQSTLQEGEGSALVDGFRYEDLFAPVTLQADQTYVLAGWYTYGTTLHSVDNVELGQGIASVGPPRHSWISGLTYPEDVVPGDAFGYLGPNMQYQVVPEPSSIMLMGCGIAAILFKNRRRLRSSLHNRR